MRTVHLVPALLGLAWLVGSPVSGVSEVTRTCTIQLLLDLERSSVSVYVNVVEKYAVLFIWLALEIFFIKVNKNVRQSPRRRR